MSELSPSYDNKITRKYSVKTLDQKVKNKTALQEEFSWTKEPKRVTACVPNQLDARSLDMLEKLMPGMRALNVHLVVIGQEDKQAKQSINALCDKHDHRIATVKNNDEYMRKILAASDTALCIGSVDKETIENCLRYAAVPICAPSDSVNNYNPVQESGNAFVYEEETEWHAFACLVRVSENFKFPYDWRTIQRHCMESIKA